MPDGDPAAEVPNGLKFCIIGAGVGGCAASSFLRQHFPSSCEIHVFEQSVTIGGRVATIRAGEGVFEAGGSIIHSKNRYMSNFVKTHKLERKAGNEGTLGIYNGEDFVFVESNFTVLTLAKLVMRYGFDVFRMKRWVGDFLNSFEKIYSLQEHEKCFSTPEKLMAALDPRFPPMLHATLGEKLRADGFGEAFINEFASGICRVNYGQSVDLGAFCGAVSLSGTGGELFAVKGGNKLVPEALVKSCTSLYLNTRVVQITSQATSSSRKYMVRYQNTGSNEGVKEQDFDAVFLCAPMDSGKMQNVIPTTGIGPGLQAFARPYQQTTASFVQGKLRYEQFTASKGTLPTMILTTRANKLGVNSVGCYETVDSEEDAPRQVANAQDVWKVFSPHAFSQGDKAALFQTTTSFQSIDWQAYPNYESADNRGKLFPFSVDDEHFYYVNAIEGCASAMEMSCIGAKNCVLMALNKFRNTSSNVDPLPSKL